MEQGNDDGSHASHVTLARAKKSTIPGLTALLAGTIIQTGRFWVSTEAIRAKPASAQTEV
jgi:hypothetical protein